ncbi:coiled-coil domain-containing protein 57 isoform X4 [Scomber scombrus]|uniref:Coiled-coil domain-containing protein 57 isoform X4 n=1 Tax=Scomber scombrus TaxID=13677 RepID=A0AAV1QDF2_SCOSC
MLRAGLATISKDIRELKQELRQELTKLKVELKQEVKAEISSIQQEIDRQLNETSSELQTQKTHIAEAQTRIAELEKWKADAKDGHTPKVDYLESEEIHHLKKQNSILRGVVSQMRKEMEGVCHLLPHAQAKSQASSPQPVQHPVTISNTADTEIAPGRAQSTEISSKSNPAAPDYTQALEQEVSLLKTRCRLLEGQLEGATGLSSLAQAEDKPAEDLAPIIQDSTHPQNHGLKHGCLCLEKHANITALKRQEFRVAHMESAPTNIMEQNMLVQQLQDTNLYLWQQQQLASGLMSGGLLKKCQGTRSYPPLLHTRLKQAASHIARLSREKQQLIEMGNCLRAQITTAGLQEPMEPERDSTEKQGDQHDQLSALEQLQYQLTTQSSKNKENTSPISQSQSSLDMRPEPHSPLSRSQLPSEESLQPLKELWEILDHELCSSIYSEGEGERSSRLVDDPCGAEVQMAVYSISAPIHSHLQAEIQQWRNLSKTPSVSTKTSRPGAPSRMSKIRNYNVKD